MLDANAEKLLKQRYYLPGETWEELCVRVTSAYTLGESVEYKEIVYNSILNLEFLPNSPAIVNAGKNRGSFACQPYWSRVLTNKGWIPIGEIVEKNLEVDVIGIEGNSKIINKMYNGFKEVYKITTEKNYTLYATGDHKVFTFDKKVVDISKGSFKKVEELDVKNYLCIPKVDIKFENLEYNYENHIINQDISYLIGHLQTDGYISQQEDGSFTLECIADTENLLQYFKSFMKTFNLTKHSSGLTRIRTHDRQTFEWLLNITNYKTDEIEVPEFIFRTSKENIASYLSACFDSEGTVAKDGEIKLTSNSKKFISGIQLLLRTFNIISSISVVYLATEKKSAHYSIFITNKRDRELFFNEIGFKNELKQMKLSLQLFEHLERRKIAYQITSIEKIGKYPVYDISTETETYISDGFYIHNCFVVGPTEDTLENHLDSLKDIAQVAKAGGGCGFTGTFIRPKNSPVNGSVHGYSYGPNAWAANVSNYMHMMTQSGFRKMALMYTLSSDHADLEDFISLKQSADEKALYNFNQSIFASDNWLNSATTKPFSNEARLFNKLVENAWNNGEPGLLFDDNINSPELPYMLSGQYINSVNPCAEEPLPPYGSCNLGSINLGKLISNGEFNFNKLYLLSRIFTRFLDNVGSCNKFPNDTFESWYKNNRPVGLGIMGLADAFLYLGIRYGSKESLQLLEKIIITMREASYDESEFLGKERGIPEMCKPVNRRNITTLTVAPTGSIAFIANCMGSGCEPVFSPTFTRTDERGTVYEVENEFFHQPYFVSVIGSQNSLTWKEHLDIQITLQKYIDAAISKTINFPNTATKEDVKEAFLYAWENKCKGITVYRDNSRQVQVLNHKEQLEVHKTEIKVALTPNILGCTNLTCDLQKKEGCTSCATCGASACSI